LYYIFHDVESGSHTITIEDVVISDDYSIYNGKNNAQSKPIKNNIYKCVNNAANETTFTMNTNNIFTGNNSVSTSSNSVAVDGRSSASPLNMFVTPSTGIINVSVSVLESTTVIWTESSDSEPVVTHVIGGFPANTDIDIYRDGVDYDTVKSNSTGYITWVYDGGFSEHEFEAIVSSETQVTVNNPGEVSVNSDAITATETQYINDLYNNVTSAITSGYTLAGLMVLTLAGGLVLRYLGYL